MTPRPPGPVLRAVLRAPAMLYHRGLGGLLGERFLMVTHAGRRSRRRYDTVLEVVGRLPSSGEYVVLAGRGRSADWLRNVAAAGAQQVTVGRRRFRAAVRELGPDEAVAVLAGYERHNRLAAPVVRAVLSGLVGWRYTGSDRDRRRLVGELPLVAFGPGTGPDDPQTQGTVDHGRDRLDPPAAGTPGGRPG
jgi:deazaflavin-dependent oxidoreductase (nitroreductase family)